jgi:surface carbohydrate biosynthesis protein
VLKTIRWRSPPRADVVVFDREGSDMLARAVLDGIPHAVLECRRETLYAGLRVLLFLVLALRKIDWRWVRAAPAGMLRAMRGELYKLYLFACVRAMRPKVVLTYIDTNWHFMWISRNYPRAQFFAIQNGVRSSLNLVDEALPSPHFAHVMDFPTLFCFGDYERDLYRRLGQRVDRFIPVGSVRGDWYRTRIAQNRPPRKFEICLVSQWLVAMLDEGPAFPEIQRSLRVLDDHLRRYLDERGGRLCIALRSNEPREREYFSRVYGARATIVEHDPIAMASYAAIDQSEIALAMDSTILREVYGWGKKTLFCNYSGVAVHRSSPVAGICYLEEPGYDVFRSRLSELLRMDEEAYRSSTGASARYLIRFDNSNPSYRAIRNAVASKLSG